MVEKPGPQPENAGVTAGYVPAPTLEDRVARLERIVDRLATVAEQFAFIADILQQTPAGRLIGDLEIENRRLRAELAEHAKGNR